MEKKIENPKIFISYSWSSKEYEERVMDLAVRLQNDGIEVIIDKWIMKPGNDTINFMEKCVKDPNVNFVLMLLDKKYTEKADKKSGGVGIETQIISNEVYNDVEQNKFIPIVFDRDENGNAYIPIYLKTRFHYDMTKENAEEEYIKLVKQIYGREIYFKPELGRKPAWVDENLNNPSSLKLKVLNIKEQVNLYEVLENEIKKFELKQYEDEENKQILKQYEDTKDYRDVLIEIFLRDYKDEDFIDDTCEFYENIKNWNKQNKGILQEIWDAFVHETFIYLIAILLKYKQYNMINTFITKSYFQIGYNENIVSFHNYFYSYNYDLISNAKCNMDDKKYYSGMATLWIENIYEPKINKKLFTQADLLLYNLSILLLDTGWYWFPITYIYAGSYNFESSLKDFSIRLKSKYEINKVKSLFGINTVEELKALFSKMQPFIQNRQERYRYSSAFEYAELITDFIKTDEIASIN